MGTLRTSASSGDRPAALRALRDALAATLEEADPPQVAQLAKQLRETLAELDSLPAPEGKSRSDELAAARASRLAKTPGAARPARGRVDVGEGGL